MHAGKHPLRKKVQAATNRLANSAGFTLLEMMVVVVIVGIVVVTAFPQYTKLVNRMSYEAAYSDLRSAVGRCRSAALGSAYPVTVPTSLTVYPNGYSCVAWWDGNGDGGIGTNGTAITGGDLVPNSLNGEVREVYFQRRFDELLEYSDTTGKVFIDFAASGLPAGGDPISGKSFVVASGGFLLAPDMTLVLNEGNAARPALVALKKRDINGGAVEPEYSVVQIFTSGQVQ